MNTRTVMTHNPSIASSTSRTSTSIDKVIEQREYWLVFNSEKKGVNISSQTVGQAGNLIASIYHQSSNGLIKHPSNPVYIPLHAIWSLPSNSASSPYILEFPQTKMSTIMSFLTSRRY
jgi:hypothetical protein